MTSNRPQTTLFTQSARSIEDRERNRPRPLRADHNLGDTAISPQTNTSLTPTQIANHVQDLSKGRTSPRVSANRSPASFSDDFSGINPSALALKRRSLEIGVGLDNASLQMAPHSTSSRSSPASSTGRVTPSSASLRISPHLHISQSNQALPNMAAAAQLSSSWDRLMGESSIGMQRPSDSVNDPSRSPVSNHSGRSSRSMPSPSSYGHRHSRSAGSETTSFADVREELDNYTRKHLQCMAEIQDIVLYLRSRQSTPASPGQTRTTSRFNENERPGVPLPPDFDRNGDGHSRPDSLGQDHLTPTIRKMNELDLTKVYQDRHKTPPSEFISSRPSHDGCVKIPPTRRAPNPDRGACHSPRYSNSGSIEISSPRSAFDTPRSHSDNSSCSSIYTS
eukprot:TRINITY_DN3751_c0_g3_i1.p1 TRINITY_DN3751_c0_g3~~TRINITY_DN3751_c0_g3_i1.p1  ORF type:complete len:393 (-),score=51.30 TRINITY_DN3751_c0_g3_i1:636-1814(-)